MAELLHEHEYISLMGSLQAFQPLAAIATTATGANLLKPLWESKIATLWIPQSVASQIQPPASNGQPSQTIQSYEGSLREQIASLWETHRGLVFCLATGAVVRLIAPLLQHKSSDPAVVVVDAAGKFVISLCSGHQGGADTLAKAVALQIGGTPVLTGAANGLRLPGIDTLGIPFGWTRGTGNWTGVSAVVARQEQVQVIQEAGSTLWQKHLPEGHPFELGDRPQEPTQANPSLSPPDSPRARIWISPIQRHFSLDSKESDLPQVQWHPRVLWVGVGCERGSSRQLIEAAIRQVCQEYQWAEGAIAGIATLDLKADEPGILQLCHDRQWALRCFSAADLRSIPVPTPSEIVEAEVGTPSVAEAAAILASHGDPARLLAPKRIVRLPDEPGAVTVAIAQAVQEYTGRTGALWLVGTGPGELTQMTPAAQTAIAQADVVIGYSLYIDLVASLLRPGQIVEALPITQERQRAERAIELAQWGLTVAVISSGDCGIYGMAGLVLEQLQAENWNGKTPSVQVFPGISALQSAASRVGAPLMHDFCAISLSDLLTPWQVIEQRLIAAAQADFVTALYNPRSRTRTHHIATAQQIFLKYRDPDTPVAIVRSAYRPDEQVILTTLSQVLDVPIDMLTTVIIGNRSTRTHAGWMITPRGYLGFES